MVLLHKRLAQIRALVTEHVESTMCAHVMLDGEWAISQEEIVWSASALMNLLRSMACCLMDQLTIMQNVPIKESEIVQLVNANFIQVMKGKHVAANLALASAQGMEHVKR